MAWYTGAVEWGRGLWDSAVSRLTLATQKAAGGMANVLTGAAGKPEWPPVGAQARLTRYAQGRRLWAGAHRVVFDALGYPRNKELPYISANLCRRLSTLLGSRLFGEPVTVTVAGSGDTKAPDAAADAQQEFADWLWRINGMQDELLLGSQVASPCGDAVYKVRYDSATGRIAVDLVAPETWFPETSPFDRAEAIAHNLDQVLELEGNEAYLWRERHELRDGAGWIVNSLYQLHRDWTAAGSAVRWRCSLTDDQVPLTTLDMLAHLPEEQSTGVSRLLVVHVPNLRVPGELFGQSDYDEALVSLQGELNARLSQRAEVLGKFVKPKVSGPALDESAYDGSGNVLLDKVGYYEVPRGEGMPFAYLTWDPQLSGVENEIRDIQGTFAATAGVNSTSLLPREGGGPTSGRALKLEEMSTQSTVAMRQRTWAPGIARLVSVASELAAALRAQGGALDWQPTTAAPLTTIAEEDVQIRFSDGLPQDRLEDVQLAVEMIDGGLQTRALAIQELFGVSAEEAEARVAVIDATKAATTPAGGSGLTGLFRSVVPRAGVDTAATTDTAAGTE